MSDPTSNNAPLISPLLASTLPSSSQPRSRQSTTTSAFSRLANLALSSTSSSSQERSSSSSSSSPISTQPPRGPAFDALESIAQLDNQGQQQQQQQRKRIASIDSRLTNEINQGGQGKVYPPRSSKRGSLRDSSESRSRERGGGGGGGVSETSSGYLAGASSGFVVDSPSSRGGSYWGGIEGNNPSYSGGVSSYGMSGFSSIREGGQGGHFFQPGAGTSGFSFEGGGGGGASYWDGSYRSSITGSPSLFGGGTGARLTSLNLISQNQTQAATSSSDESKLSIQQPWGEIGRGVSPIGRSRAQSPSLVRSESPIGGGRKLKELSRRLRYSIGQPGVTAANRDKGLVGIAKPPKDGNGELGRVAVAGKTSLKLLKIPHGSTPRRNPTQLNTATSHIHRSSSIADRRSRSRGRAAGGVSPNNGRRNESVEPSEGDIEEREEVSEVMDVRSGSRLSPGYLFSDVRWGYGATSNKLATACTNGAVILWDLNREGGSKLDQVKYEHDRAVNRIVFGGQTGNWLMSGGQDGQMKLWDIRESRPSSMILKASSPVRHLSFSPSASQPFTLLAACASGTLIRYDVRYISRQNGGATDRIAGHIGSCLAMDWRDGFDCEKGGAGPGVSQETAGGGKEGGWVVTGGIDSTIKIWDFSLPTLSTKPVRTLYPTQPVQSVSWHPTNGTELASAPLPSLSLGSDAGGGGGGGGDETTPTTPVAMNNPFRDGSAAKSGGNSWKNEIAIWDTRRPYFPKLSIKTDDPSSAILFNDDETIWATSKTSPTFHQHDTASDSYSLLDCIDRPSAAWNLEGDFVFVDDTRTPFDVPFERMRAPVPVNSDKFLPEVYIATVTDLDPDFSTETFCQLANNLQLVGDFDEICDENAHVSFMAGRPDAAQVWAVIKTWFGKSPFSAPDSPPPTPPTDDTSNEKTSPPLVPAPDWILSPTSTTHSDSASKSHRHHRFSLSSSMRNSPSTRRQASNDTFDSSMTAMPSKDSVKQLLDTFSEESTASETDLSAQSPYYPELSSTSSDSENDVANESRRLHKASVASLPTNRLAASLAALAESQKNGETSSVTRSIEENLPKRSSRTPSRLQSRRNSSSSSSSDSDSSLDETGNVNDPTTAHKSSRTAKIAALHASLIANRSRRPSAGQSSERRPLRSRDSTLPGRQSTRKQSAEGGSWSRRGSAAQNGGAGGVGGSGGNRVASSGGPAGAKKDSKDGINQSSEDLSRQAGAMYAAQAFEIVKEQLKATLIDYADRGDSQLCAVVCCVLQHEDLGFDSLWTARITKAYLDMLRQLDLHVPAAELNKYCSTLSLRTLTQDSVVFHTACGRCGKGIEQAPYDFCQKCRILITTCCICHLSSDSLFVFCACCGHGMHESCLHGFAGSHSVLAASQPQTPNTVPSTPGIATPLRTWLWGEGTSVVDSEDGLENGFDQISLLLSHCPSGSCSHSC